MSKAAVVAKYSKSSGISKATLGKVYQRGLGAYYSSGSRPKVSAHQWAAGRVRSFGKKEMMTKQQKAKVKKVASGLRKASRSHAGQAKILQSLLKKKGKK